MIITYSSDQHQVLRDIAVLHNEGKPFDVDVTYGNGSFYKGESAPYAPHYRFDIDPQVSGVVEACSTNVPLPDASVGSVVFDPPFLTYIKQGREHGSVMAKRFGGYYRYDELVEHYKNTLAEASRILRLNGIVVVKCQDIIHNHALHPTHIYVHNWALEYNLKIKDLFILQGKGGLNTMPDSPGMTKPRTQKHARVKHSYFMVFAKKRKVVSYG